MRPIAKWTLAAGAAIAAHSVLFWAGSLNPSPRSAAVLPSASLAEIAYIGDPQEGQPKSLAQQIELFDPRPLLLPTQWNFASAPKAGTMDAQPPLFDDFGPAFQLESGDFVAGFGNRWQRKPEFVETALGLKRNPFSVLGHRPANVAARDRPPSILLEVIDPANGRRIYSRRLSGPAARELIEMGQDWTPALLLASARHSFVAKRLSVAVSSGREEVDRRLLALAESIELSRIALSDGSYFLRFGP